MSVGMAPNLAGGLLISPFGSGNSGGGESGDPFAIPASCNGGGGGGGDNGGDPGGGGGGGSCSIGGSSDRTIYGIEGINGGMGGGGNGSMPSLGGSVSNNFLFMKQNRGIPVPMPRNSRPGGDVVRYVLDAKSLCPPDPYPTPPPVPSSGSQEWVTVRSNSLFFVSGVPITCKETGVTLANNCSPGYVIFYHPVVPTVTHYSSPAGPGASCTYPYSGYNCTAGAVEGNGSTHVLTIPVDTTPL